MRSVHCWHAVGASSRLRRYASTQAVHGNITAIASRHACARCTTHATRRQCSTTVASQPSRAVTPCAAQRADVNVDATASLPLPRRWVAAPLSRLSSVASRRDWFRVMSFNMMADCWSRDAATSPVRGVQLRVPAFTRQTHAPPCGRRDRDDNGSDADDTTALCDFCDYDAAVDAEVPPFVQPEFRRAHLLRLLDGYDADIVCLNEVSRSYFEHVLWRHVRYRGYGMLYCSSRAARVRAWRHASSAQALSRLAPTRVNDDDGGGGNNVDDNNDSVAVRQAAGGAHVAAAHNARELLVPPHEDIGNVVLFHKGRFCPILMPGHDLAQRLHFLHLVAMRDKVTNMTVNVACVQLTAGSTDEAAAVRRHEMRQTLMLLDALTREDSDRSHMTPLLCGDFNNEDEEEACVQLAREQYFSTYDVVGGPRWTAWYYTDASREATYRQKYYPRNVAQMHRDKTYKTHEQVRDMVQKHKQQQQQQQQQRQQRQPQLQRQPQAQEQHDEPHMLGSMRRTRASELVRAAQDNAIQAQKQHTHSTRHTRAAMQQDDQLHADSTSLQPLRSVTMTDIQDSQRVVKRTQDYIFYDPRTLSLHKVLDIPDNDALDAQQALPSHKLPSHHLPLLIDVSYTNTNPEVLQLSTKP